MRYEESNISEGTRSGLRRWEVATMAAGMVGWLALSIPYGLEYWMVALAPEPDAIKLLLRVENAIQAMTLGAVAVPVMSAVRRGALRRRELVATGTLILVCMPYVRLWIPALMSALGIDRTVHVWIVLSNVEVAIEIAALAALVAGVLHVMRSSGRLGGPGVALVASSALLIACALAYGVVGSLFYVGA